MRTSNLNYRTIAKQALEKIDHLLPRWLPNQKYEGGEYVACNPKRRDLSLGSFKVNRGTGKWADFATGDRGGDLISLYAYLHDLSQYQSALEISKLLNGR